MIIIGITGSIGTGKTTVSNMLKILRIPIFDSDEKVKEILDWQPAQSSIDNVVATAVQWYNKTHKKEIQ